MARTLTAGQRMIASAKELIAFAEGADNGSVVYVPDDVVSTPKIIDPARIRKKIGMSQQQFAFHFGVSRRTVQEWEQGRAVPSGPARAFLTVIDREPDAVRRALVADQEAHTVELS